MAKQPLPPPPRRIPLHGAPIIPNAPKRDDEPQEPHHQVVTEDWDEEPVLPTVKETEEPAKVNPPIDVKRGTPLNKVPAKFRKLL